MPLLTTTMNIKGRQKVKTHITANKISDLAYKLKSHSTIHKLSKHKYPEAGDAKMSAC